MDARPHLGVHSSVPLERARRERHFRVLVSVCLASGGTLSDCLVVPRGNCAGGIRGWWFNSSPLPPGRVPEGDVPGLQCPTFRWDRELAWLVKSVWLGVAL